MCRIFGFRSVLNSQVHRSLLGAENALSIQSGRHPDGWGVAYYQGGYPHLIRSPQSAINDEIFARVSGVVASETVVAHVRRATQGSLTQLNTHPFQFGPWVFAHNGNLSQFEEHRPELVDRIPPQLRRYVLGQTDSEVLFYLLLAAMDRRGSIHNRDYPLDALIEAARETVDEVCAIVGDMEYREDAPPTSTFLTFVITNGLLMAGHQGGKPLHYSTWKRSCPDRTHCSYFGAACEAPPATGYVNHLLLSSEPLQGENVWTPLTRGQIVGVDGRMRLFDLPPPNLAATLI